MRVSSGLLVICAGAVLLCSSAGADNLEQPTRVPNLPGTVIVKTDMVFHVPFSVTGDTVPVRAGTEVSLNGVRDKYLKLAYGPGELTVDPAQTDFAERMSKLPQLPLAQITNIAVMPAKRSSPPTGLATNLAKAESRGVPWMGIFIVALLLLGGGIAAFKEEIEKYFRTAARQKRRDLVALGQPSHGDIAEALSDLDWFQFEKLVAALFQAKGNIVEMRGGANADGGIDLVVDSGSSTAAVQCKHWSKWKCGPNVVRELIGSMKHENFSRGFLVCRTATHAALDLAAQEQITIIDRDALVDRIATAIDADNEEVRHLLFAPEKLCPKCGAAMVLRTVAKGSNTGSEFWGCSKYPNCRQTMRV